MTTKIPELRVPGRSIPELGVPGRSIPELVDAARQGDRAAFDELVRTTYVQTYTLALRLTNNTEDACDVVQETYLRAYRSLDRFRGDAQFTTWLFRITANCAATQLTKSGRHRHEALDEETAWPTDVSAGPEMRADAALDRRDVVAALGQLPAGLRHVIVLRDIYDLAHQDIAKELGVSEGAAKLRLHRARKRLRDLLLSHEGEGQNARAV